MEEPTATETSVFQTKYNEFVEDLLGALPEYALQIQASRSLDDKTKLNRFQEEVKVGNTLGTDDTNEHNKNPGKVLPGVEISDTVWASLSEQTRKAIWEYVRILSICCFMEAGFSESSKPDWMDDAMNDMKKKLEGFDFQSIIGKFATFFKSGTNAESGAGAAGAGGAGESSTSGLPAGLEGLFENGFPKIPEKFLKGHMAKLAQEIVKDITPEDLGISKEMIEECEKDPSRAFDVLFKVFGSNPGNIQKIVQKIGKRLQQKITSGAIRPQEIAREAEELMKEFAGNSSFVDMMDGIKGAFGFQDMDLARQAGREGSARLSMVKERLKKKASEKEAKKAAAMAGVVAPISASAAAIAEADAAMTALLNEEASTKKSGNKKMPGKGGKK
uniref:Uncharacterized protein n=1 Tax=viral metagenome TaxID=1070528 RepID=A0A6C0DUX0_9ZZZZ